MIPEPEHELRRAWHDLLTEHESAHAQSARDESAQDTALPGSEIIDDLLRRYAEPHRHYHTATHIMWVLRHVDALIAADDHPTGPIDRPVLIAATLFHDAVYEVVVDVTDDRARPRLSNEVRSAQLAADQLTRLGWTQPRLDLVSALIEATETHIATSSDTAIVLDADLAILGADAAAYAAYTRAVRAEYSTVDDQHWRIGRAAVLQGFLQRPNIFATPTMVLGREAAARANISGELAQLEQTAGRSASPTGQEDHP